MRGRICLLRKHYSLFWPLKFRVYHNTIPEKAVAVQKADVLQTHYLSLSS